MQNCGTLGDEFHFFFKCQLNEEEINIYIKNTTAADQMFLNTGN